MGGGGTVSVYRESQSLLVSLPVLLAALDTPCQSSRDRARGGRVRAPEHWMLTYMLAQPIGGLCMLAVCVHADPVPPHTCTMENTTLMPSISAMKPRSEPKLKAGTNTGMPQPKPKPKPPKPNGDTIGGAATIVVLFTTVVVLALAGLWGVGCAGWMRGPGLLGPAPGSCVLAATWHRAAQQHVRRRAAIRRERQKTELSAEMCQSYPGCGPLLCAKGKGCAGEGTDLSRALRWALCPRPEPTEGTHGADRRLENPLELTRPPLLAAKAASGAIRGPETSRAAMPMTAICSRGLL